MINRSFLFTKMAPIIKMAFLMIKLNLLMIELVSVLKCSLLRLIFDRFFECGHNNSNG